MIGAGLAQPVAHASVPLAFNGTSRGVLNVAALPGHSFDEAELRFLETVGRQVCVAVEGARHHKAERLYNQEAQGARRAQQGHRRVARPGGGAGGRRAHRARHHPGRPRLHPARLRLAPAGGRPRRGPAAPGAEQGRPRRPHGDGRQPAPPRPRAAGAARHRGLGERPERQQGHRAALGRRGGADPAARRPARDARPARPDLRRPAPLDRGPDRRRRGARVAGLGRARERAALREGPARLPRAERGAGPHHPEREDGGRRHVRLGARPRGAQPAELDRAPAVDPRAARGAAAGRRRRRDQGAGERHPRGGEAARQPGRRLPAVLAQQPRAVPPGEPRLAGRRGDAAAAARGARRRRDAAAAAGRPADARPAGRPREDQAGRDQPGAERDRGAAGRRRRDDRERARRRARRDGRTRQRAGPAGGA